MLEKKITKLENGGTVYRRSATQASATKTARKPASGSPDTSVARKKWVLRSVVRGVAWVSLKSQAGMTRVKVGDRLAGAGKVLSIKKMQGIWIVKTENGNIRP